MPANPMFPHQLEGSVRLGAGTPTYLGFDMGIGKTRTFIEAVKLRDAKRALVICPASAVLVWKREIAIWHPGALVVVVRNVSDLLKPGTYYLVTHGLMSQASSPVANALSIGRPFDMAAVDEAQAFNAADTNRVKALRKIAPRLGNIYPLSGTPMKNHAGDLYTLLSICWPQGLRMTRADYEAKFCVVTHKRFGPNAPMVRVIEGSKNLEVLKTLIAPFMFRVRREDVLKDLPAIIWDHVPVPLDKSHMPESEFKRLEEFINGVMAAKGSTAGLDALTAALSKLSTEASLMTVRRMLGLAKLRGATEYIIDMLDNLPPNRKVLVFAHHADVIKSLHAHLAEYSPAVLTGQSSPREREEAVDKFLKDPRCRVFVGNIQAAGTAITLVGPTCKCSDVVFVESSWTPMDNAQAACRVHRIGQKDGVVVRMLSAAGTVDDLINSLLVRKAREFTQLFDTQGAQP
jgi:SWI/SNF-related matrix-associated actin-dependent regulator 1 of chromatin subfamily A